MATKKLVSLFLTDFSLAPSFVHGLLYVLFFCSGVSALIYQVMWERMLFTEFGVDLESITIIVSVFMFGLGIGGLLGGHLADKHTKRLLGLYIIIEMAIAIFGFFSPYFIPLVGHLFFSDNKLMTVLASFLVLSFPTILMGATFPILVRHVNQTLQHIGHSVGSLYFANTLGGAVGAYFSGFVLLYTLNIVEVIERAAWLNVTIALIAFLAFRKQK